MPTGLLSLFNLANRLAILLYGNSIHKNQAREAFLILSVYFRYFNVTLHERSGYPAALGRNHSFTGHYVQHL